MIMPSTLTYRFEVYTNCTLSPCPSRLLNYPRNIDYNSANKFKWLVNPEVGAIYDLNK